MPRFAERYIAIIYHARMYRPADRENLINKARDAVKQDKIKLIDVRVGTEHVEFDFITEESGYRDIITKVMQGLFGENMREVKKIGNEEDAEDEQEIIREAVKLFNQERYWETHEKLEPLWRKARDMEKKILHAIILASASLVNLQKNKIDRAVSIMERAYAELPKSIDEHRGVDLRKLREDISKIVEKGEVRPFRIRYVI